MRRSREIPPLYLEPVSVPRPKPSDPVALTYLEPRIIVHGQSLMPVRYSSSPEHTYEEVNDKGCLGDDQYLSKDQCYLKDWLSDWFIDMTDICRFWYNLFLFTTIMNDILNDVNDTTN